MTVNDQLPDPQSLGYEEARDELVRIVLLLDALPTAEMEVLTPRDLP